jgi:hypothetical protein
MEKVIPKGSVRLDGDVLSFKHDDGLIGQL